MRSSIRMTLAFLAALTVVGCTRDVLPKEKIRLVIPFNNGSSSLAAGDRLRNAIVNIQVPGRPPMLKEFDFHDNPVPWGTPLDLVVPGVPSGPGLLVQFLGVFETSIGGATLLTYGDAVVNVGTGTTLVNITAAPAGTALREGDIAGRYLTGDGVGPTGPVITYFNPPNGRPRMAVNKSDIVNGWFKFFVLDSAPLTYVMADSGITIFGNVTLDSPIFTGSQHVLKVIVPPHFKPDNEDNVINVEQRVEQTHILGFFTNGAVTLATAHKACYANASEGAAGLYSTYANGMFQNPLLISMGASSGPLVRAAAGTGYSVSLESWGLEDTCDPALQNYLVYHHNRIREGDEGFSGMKPPFRVVDRFAPWGGYMLREYDSTGNKIDLHWRYLPGTAPGEAGSGINGVDILYKYSENGGGGWSGRDETCHNLFEEGFQVHGSLTIAEDTYAFENGGGISIGAGNHWNYSFAACPYTVKDDKKVYVGNFIRSEGCNGGCSELSTYGWGTQDFATYTGDILSEISQKSDQVQFVSSPNLKYDVLTLSGSGNFSPGDVGKEVQLMVVANGDNSACGEFNGAPIGYGTRGYARILSATSNTIKISRGTFVRGLNTSALALPLNNAGFCRVIATIIPHFKSLTIAENTSVSTFDYNTGGGMLMFRVSGIFSMSPGVTISAYASGYSPGAGTDYPGAGHLGTDFVGSGGQAISSTGGGGASPVANGGKGSTDGVSPDGGDGGLAPWHGGSSFGNQFTLGLGGGGGHNNFSSWGGGIIMIAARYIAAPEQPGLNASGGNSAGAGGAGGGGSIGILAERILPGSSLNVVARGGDGFSGPPSGGAGGGGIISAAICSNAAGLNTPVGAVSGGTSVLLSDGAAENGVIWMPGIFDYNPACNL